jgi:uncharacterized protein YpmB
MKKTIAKWVVSIIVIPLVISVVQKRLFEQIEKHL